MKNPTAGPATVGSFLSLILGLVLPMQASAQVSNPIDPGLPLTTHASTSCSNGTLAGITNPGDAFATCAGAQSAENPATLAHVTASDEATADLRTGTLKAVATSSAYGFGDDRLHVGSQSVATFYDTVTILGPVTGAVSIMMHLSLDGGFFNNGGTTNTGNSELLAKLSSAYGGSGVDIKQGASGGVFINTQSGFVTTNMPSDASTFSDPADVRVDLAMPFDVSPTARSFTFLAQILVDSVAGYSDLSPQVNEGRVDYSNTAHLSIDLPDGYAFSSASGLLLTDIAAPVPEPVQGLLLLVGLIPLTARLLSRRRKQEQTFSG